MPSAAGGSNRCREAEAGTPEDNVGEGAEASVLVAVMAALVPIGGVASMVATPLHAQWEQKSSSARGRAPVRCGAVRPDTFIFSCWKSLVDSHRGAVAAVPWF